jgi:hypothetical protein
MNQSINLINGHDERNEEFEIMDICEIKGMLFMELNSKNMPICVTCGNNTRFVDLKTSEIFGEALCHFCAKV